MSIGEDVAGEIGVNALLGADISLLIAHIKSNFSFKSK
jgi:hypothetical protein